MFLASYAGDSWEALTGLLVGRSRARRSAGGPSVCRFLIGPRVRMSRLGRFLLFLRLIFYFSASSPSFVNFSSGDDNKDEHSKKIFHLLALISP